MWEGLGEYKRKSKSSRSKYKRELKPGLDEFQTSAWNRIPLVTKALLAVLMSLLIIFLILILFRSSELLSFLNLPWQPNQANGQAIPTPRAGAPGLIAVSETVVYAGPGSRFKVLGKLETGQWAEVAGSSPDEAWWVIRVPEARDGLGWVLAQSVKVQGMQAIGTKPGMTLSDNQMGPGMPQLAAQKNTSIQAGPGTQYETLGYLEAGEAAAVIGVSADKLWWAIKIPYYESGIGWVIAANTRSINTDGVQVLQADEGNQGSASEAQNALVISVVTNVNVRNGPGLTYSKIGLLNTGDTAQAVGVDPERFWLAILVPGAKDPGWIAVDYVNPQDIKRLSGLPVINRLSSGKNSMVPLPASGDPLLTAVFVVNIRSGPGTQFQVLGKLDQGQQAEIVGASADGLWWVIKLDGVNNNQGWVAAAYVQAQNVATVPIIK
jgi:uncharacterized protein YraI